MSDKTLPADFRLYVNVTRNRKTRRLMREMGDRAFYCIVALWCYTAENCPDGDLGDMDAFDLADMSFWPVERAEEWMAYLIDNRWLDRDGNSLHVHGWADMQPWAARDRSKQSEANRKNANIRWAKEKENANSHAIAMQSQCEPKMQLQCPHTQSHTHTQSLDQEHIGSKDPREVEPVEKPVKKPNMQPEVDALFKFWTEVMSKPGAKLSPKRKARIEWALKEYGDERARKAIIGCASSAFHMGENEHGKRFDDLELIFRNSEKFESFEALGEKARTYTDAVTGFTVVAITPPEEKGRVRSQKEQPHPFFDNKGQEFGIVKMMRRRAEEKAREDAARNTIQAEIVEVIQ